MRSKILYIGNKLSSNGSTATSIETLGSFLESEGFVIYYASSFKNKTLRLLDMIFSTIRYCRKVNYVMIDVYSTQNFWYAIIISQLCRILHLKYICKLHGGNLPNRLERNPMLCNLVFNYSYFNLAPSMYLLDAFAVNKYKNLMFVPNTIDLKEYQFTKRQIEAPKLLWVRSFSSIYNPLMAVKVLYYLQKEYPKAELCMVGPDKENLIKDCKELAHALKIDVKFTGMLTKEEWVELSKEYNFFINTTHYDNTPVSVIEAMALGLSIVSTNVGGVPYLIQEKVNGLLVEDDNVVEMTEAIKSLINDDVLRRQMLLNSRKLVEQFDWEKIKFVWFDILK